MDPTLSESNVSLKLSLIRKRCEQLQAEELNELSLEDAESQPSLEDTAYNPYDKT